MFPSELSAIEVVVKTSSSKNHQEFLGSHDINTFYGADGSPVSWRPVVSVNGVDETIIHTADPVSTGSLGTFRPSYQKLSIYGWSADLPEPDDAALTDLRQDAAAQNMARSGEIPRSEVRAEALTLGEDFRAVLDSAENEEDIQVFLASNPQVLYPDFIDCHPRFPLGEEFVPDYVYLVQGTAGQEYVFVEIERPEKSVFVSKNHFTSHFTQAKDQLLQWSTWITDNHQYLERKLPNLGRPKFHLVMGRSTELNATRRKTLQAEFSGTDRRYSTFDDILERYLRIVDTLFP